LFHKLQRLINYNGTSIFIKTTTMASYGTLQPRNTILSFISKMTIQRDGENYDYFNGIVRPVGHVDAGEDFYATAKPMENTRKENDPQFHPLIENKSFDVKGADEKIMFKVIASGIEKRTGFCWSISHQRQIVRSEDSHLMYGEVKGESCVCCLPHYTVHTPTAHTYMSLKYKLRPRLCALPIWCCSQKAPIYDIFHADIRDGVQSIGHVSGEEILFPECALDQEKVCIIGGQLLINTNSL
jgi:hypothetical protein